MTSPSEPNDESVKVPDGFCHLGNFGVFEAERLLKQFEDSGIRFQLEKVKRRIFTSGGMWHGAGYSTATSFDIFVQKDDEQKAVKILTADWKV
jgi:hypothetical protein